MTGAPEGRSDRFAEAAVMIAVALSPWYFGCAPDLGRYSLSAFLLVAAAAASSSQGSRSPGLSALALPALGLLQILAGSTVASVWTAEAALLLSATLSVLLLVARASTDATAAARLASSVVLAGLAQGAFGVYAWSVGPSRIYGVMRPDVTMPFGSFVNHNHFAGLMEMSALLAFGMALGHARRARQLTAPSIGLSGLGLGLAAAHVASRSRGGLVALAAGISFCAAVTAAYWRSHEEKPAKARRLGLAALGALLVLGFGLAVVSPPARRHLATLLTPAGDSSGSYRIDTARATLRLFAAHPLLGAGLGAYEDALPPHKLAHGDVRTTHAESDLLEWLAEGGLVGLAALVWLAVASVRRFEERLREGRDAFRKGIAIGAAGGAVAHCVHSLLDFNLRIPSNALLFVVLLGLATAPVGQKPLQSSSPLARRLAAILLLVLAGSSVWRAQGAWAFQQSMKVSDPNARIERLDWLLRTHPYLAEGWRERGLAWRELAMPPSALRGLRLQRAVDDLSNAVKLRPAWGEAWVDRGWTLAMLGEFAAASRDIANGRRLDPSHPGIRLVEAEFLSKVPGTVQR
jgi:O-antigen ligase